LRRRDGFERNYAPFFRLLEWHREVSGAERYSLLWRLARWERDGERSELEVWPLVSWRKGGRAGEPAGGTDVRLLKGLLGYRREAGRRELRLLYLLRIGLGGTARPEATP
jgi:hypothetical protein